MNSRKTYVYKSILQRILKGEFSPGHILNRREVAEMLEVSISPVNEAFAILQSEGIIETIPRKGTFVTRLDWRDLYEILKVRVALESEAARAYCGETIRKEKEKFLEMAEQVDSTDPASLEHLMADIVFHRSLIQLAGNKLLSSMFTSVITRSLLLVSAAVNKRGPSESSDSHVDFVHRLCDAEPESVYDIIRLNVMSGKEDVFISDVIPRTDSNGNEDALDFVLSILQESKE